MCTVAATKISKGILLRDPHAYKSCFTFEDSFTTTYAYNRFSLTWFDFYNTCSCLWIEFIKAKNNFNFRLTSTKRNIAVSQWEFRMKKSGKKKLKAGWYDWTCMLTCKSQSLKGLNLIDSKTTKHSKANSCNTGLILFQSIL